MVGMVAVTVVVWIAAAGFGAAALRSTGLVRRLQAVLAAAACAGLGLALGTLLVLLHVFDVFAGEALVARVTSTWLAPQRFQLTYEAVGHGDTPALHVQLEGDQWAISGGFVKWHPWLAAIGLSSYHKPMRLSGQFSRLAAQRSHASSVYGFSPDADRIWELLYRLDPYLPFIEAVYGSAASVYVEPQWVQEVYVTTSGYLIKRGRRVSQSAGTSVR